MDIPQLDFEVLAVQVQDNSDDFGATHSACLGKRNCGTDCVLDTCLGWSHWSEPAIDRYIRYHQGGMYAFVHRKNIIDILAFSHFSSGVVEY